MGRGVLLGLWVVAMACAPAWAEEDPEVAAEKGATLLCTALGRPGGEKTLKEAFAKDAKVPGLVATRPAHLARTLRALALHAPGLHARSAEVAETVVAWAEKSVPPAAGTEVSTNVLLARAARARLALARGEKADAVALRAAASHLATEGERARSGPEGVILALAIFGDAIRAETGPRAGVVEEARVLCVAAAPLLTPKSEDLRRAIAASYRLQGETLVTADRGKSQDAFREYFKTFAPFLPEEPRPTDDVLEHNAVVTYVRSKKLDLKEDYVSEPVAIGNLIDLRLPVTDHWKHRGDIEQVFEDPLKWRSISFQSYTWDSVYGGTEIGGDNVKGIANGLFDRASKGFAKIGKKSGPARQSWNSRMPSGIGFTLEGTDIAGTARRIRYLAVKSVKIETTVVIRIDEAAGLPAVDPEWDFVLDSMDIAVKTR